MSDNVQEFLAHQGVELDVSDEDMEDFLAHYGVPGMKWGKRKFAAAQRNHQLNKASRANDRAAAKEAVAKNDRAILKARQRISSGKTTADFKAAKAKYRTDKVNVGSREARKTLARAREKRMQDITKSKELMSGKEQIQAAIIGGALSLLTPH